jgi:hypothetical protein
LLRWSSNGGVTQKIHVRGRCAEQHGLLAGAERLAGGEYLAFRLPRAIAGLKAVEESLGRGHAERGRGRGAFGLGIDGRAGAGRLNDLVDILLG